MMCILRGQIHTPSGLQRWLRPTDLNLDICPYHQMYFYLHLIPSNAEREWTYWESLVKVNLLQGWCEIYFCDCQNPFFFHWEVTINASKLLTFSSCEIFSDTQILCMDPRHSESVFFDFMAVPTHSHSSYILLRALENSWQTQLSILNYNFLITFPRLMIL